MVRGFYFVSSLIIVVGLPVVGIPIAGFLFLGFDMVQSLMLGQQIGPAMVKALGLPARTVWFELRCAVDEAVTVKCEYLPSDGNSLVVSFVEYELTRRTPPNTEESFDVWMAKRKEAAHRSFLNQDSDLAKVDAVLLRKALEGHVITSIKTAMRQVINRMIACRGSGALSS